MQQTDEPRQPEEPRVGLEQHALHLVELRRRPRPAALVLRRLLEALRHRREDLELHERHGLEHDLERERWRRRVQLDIVRAEVPELVREHDGLVEPFGPRLVTLIRNEVYVFLKKEISE